MSSKTLSWTETEHSLCGCCCAQATSVPDLDSGKASIRGQSLGHFIPPVGLAPRKKGHSGVTSVPAPCGYRPTPSTSCPPQAFPPLGSPCFPHLPSHIRSTGVFRVHSGPRPTLPPLPEPHPAIPLHQSWVLPSHSSAKTSWGALGFWPAHVVGPRVILRDCYIYQFIGDYTI